MKPVRIRYAWNGENGKLFETVEMAMANRPENAYRLFKILITDTHIISQEEEELDHA